MSQKQSRNLFNNKHKRHQNNKIPEKILLLVPVAAQEPKQDTETKNIVATTTTTTTTAAAAPTIMTSSSSSNDSQEGGSLKSTTATSSLSPSLAPKINSIKPQPIQRSHSTSFPLVVSNEKSSHMFPLLPTPGAQFGILLLLLLPPAPTAQLTLPAPPTKQQQQSTQEIKALSEDNALGEDLSLKVSLSSTGSDQTNVMSLKGVTSTEETSISAPSRGNDEDDDVSRPRTLRYNWTDYEDRLLLKIILSNHSIIHDLRYKPLKRFWELVADLIKKYSINTKVPRTHRQCRERFYVLYNKLVKFAEQLGIDPTALHRRLSQGLCFTELEELYLKILQVLRLEDGFKLVVNKEFYNDPNAVELLDKSVSFVAKDDETVSMPSSKSSDEKDELNVVINNKTSQHNKITPFTSLKRNASKISKFSFSTGSFSPSTDNNNTDRSELNHEQDRVNLDDIMSSPPITRLDNRSYSSLSSGVSSTRAEDVKPNVFLKDKKRRNNSNQSSTNSHRYSTNVDDSSNSSLGSGSNSQGESNGEMESSSSNSNSDTPIGPRDMEDYIADAELKVIQEGVSTDKNAAALQVLARRMDKIDTNIEDLHNAIAKMDDKMKNELSDAFDRISKFQDGINENIALIVSELRNSAASNAQAKNLENDSKEKEKVE